MDPMKQISDLEQRLREACEPFGLILQQSAFIPSPEPEIPPMMNVVFAVDRDKAFKTLEQIDMEREFEMIARREKHQANEDKFVEARDGLLRMLGMDPDNFLSVPLPEIDTPELSGNVPIEASQDDLFKKVASGEISTFDLTDEQVSDYMKWLDRNRGNQ